jgi:hypothetical protein
MGCLRLGQTTVKSGFFDVEWNTFKCCERKYQEGCPEEDDKEFQFSKVIRKQNLEKGYYVRLI